MRILTRREYANRKFRSESAVHLWIKTGRISPEALVPLQHRKGTGIWVERADADLAQNLDPGQQRAQSYPIAVANVATSPEPAAADVPAAGSFTRIPLRARAEPAAPCFAKAGSGRRRQGPIKCPV
jgi:hypothetical protein